MCSSQQTNPSASHLPTLASCSPGLPPPLVFLSLPFFSLSLPMSEPVHQVTPGASYSSSFLNFFLSPSLVMLSLNFILTTAIFILLQSSTLSPVPSHSFGFEASDSYYKSNACINYSLALNILHLQKVNQIFFSVKKYTL